MARRIDHLVVAVRDLDEAGALYERLGFLVGARNRHPWGTENRLIQFGSSFIELITVGEDGDAIPPHEPRRFSFGAFVRDRLETREGLAMLVLDSADAAADARRFQAEAIGDFEPFFFERRGRRPDGTQTTVAFTLAFAVDPAAPEAGFFTCQQHDPENFWNPDFQRHPNGASDILRVTLSTPRPEAHRAFLAAFTGARAPDGEPLRFALGGGRIDVERTSCGAAHLSGFALAVRDLGDQAERLRAAGIPFEVSGDALVVPPRAAHGLAIRFEPA